TSLCSPPVSPGRAATPGASSRRAAPGWTGGPPSSPRPRSAPMPCSRSSTSPTASSSPPAPPTSSPAPCRRSRWPPPAACAWTPAHPRSGAATAGFIEVLLRRGAAAVIAVDIGHDQLAEHVRTDPRVTVRDGTSVRDLTPELLGTAVDLLVADLSFISLRTVIPALAGVVRRDGELLLMVKPQFEVGRAAL